MSDSGSDHATDETPPVDATTASEGEGEGESVGVFVRGLLDARSAGSKHRPDPAIAARIGRYTVVDKLGEGGMGVVYLCRDPELERDVAVKLLRSHDHSSRRRARMRREAQGLARLSHPNVVPIYEVGEHKGELFLAMEFVAGQTLRRWLEEREPDDWRARLTKIVAAGRGLEAAHAAGLIHRDFKPDNVIVGDDGRVRVLDFGLVRARGLDDLDAPASESASQSDDQPSSLEHPLTADGAVLGTPAYMAPEQLQGQPATAASDQFAFCVVAYQALYGQRPYDIRALASHGPDDGELRPQPPLDHVSSPRHLRQLLVRGLALDPTARWPSLSALLDALEAVLDRRRRQRRWLLAGAAAVLATGVGVGLSLADPPELAPSPPCQIDASALAGVWDQPRQTQLHAAFVASGLDFAEQAAEVVEATLDDWRDAWVAAQRSACEATHVHQTQSSALLDRRSACLERKRVEAAATIDVLTDADPETVGRSLELLGQLPDLGPCASEELAQARHPLPSDPERRATILAAFADIARARALADAGRLDQAQALASELTSRLSAEPHPPLKLELRALDGHLLFAARETGPAIETLLEVARAAEAAHLDELVASVRVELALSAAGVWGRPETERLLHADARAALDRVARDRDPRRCDLLFAGARLDDGDGQLDAALDQARRALDCAETHELLGRAALARKLVGQQLAALGQFAEAEAHLERALAAAAEHHGPRSTYVGDLEHDLALLATLTGRFDDAEAHLERARPIYAAVFGPASEQSGQLDYASAHVALLRGDLGRAAALFETTLQRWRERSAHVAPDRLADAWEAQGVVRYYAGDYAGSISSYREALALRERLFGPEHPAVAISYSNIGESQAALGDHEAALAAYERAITSLTRSLPADHPDLALPYKARGKSRLALGEVEAAIADLERALAIHDKHPGEPAERADVEASLARARAARP